MHTQRAAAAA
ncbi:hypothetical protein YPPY10_3829, partial [Yersinia pestis PY-10]